MLVKVQASPSSRRKEITGYSGANIEAGVFSVCGQWSDEEEVYMRERKSIEYRVF